jgi:undecaprenyl-diphosphatase
VKADAALLAQWAAWAGQHALPLFAAMLALLLAATWAWWSTVRRFTEPRGQSTLSPTHFVGLRIAAGVAVVLIGTGVFAALAGQLHAQEELGQADLALTGALRASVPPWALQVFAALTHLGDTATLTGLCIGMAIALVALGRRGLALGWVAAIAGNGLLNQTLKQIFARVRPLAPDGIVLEQGFSFPSGHSSGSVVAYGMLAYVALRLLPARWHLPALAAAVALAFTVGASRMFLGVHFASDVIAGFASGAAWLAVCVTSMEAARCSRAMGAH